MKEDENFVSLDNNFSDAVKSRHRPAKIPRINELEVAGSIGIAGISTNTARTISMNRDEAIAILTGLYRSYFGRAPDQSGLDWWTNVLVNGQNTPSGVGMTFETSAEGVEYTSLLESKILNIYWDELGRVADPEGFNYWVSALRRGVDEWGIRQEIRNSPEGVAYRAGNPSPPPDPRSVQLRSYDTNGDSHISYRTGDSLQSLALLAYGRTEYWWVIAQSNKAMTNAELATRSVLKVPNMRASYNVMQIGDNGYAALMVSLITGEQYEVQYVPISSQLEPIEFEENPNWLQGLAFVNGNDAWQRSDFYISRSRPNPVMPPIYWDTVKDAVSLPIEEIGLPPSVDTSQLTQLPVFNPSDSASSPPPPPIKYTAGSDPSYAVVSMKKYPAQVLDAVRLSGIVVVTVKKSVVEFVPKLGNEFIPGWNGAKWDQSPGGFFPDRSIVVVATDPDRKAQGSESFFDHEFAHAYDYSMGALSRSAAFEAAFKADYKALEAESRIGYYTKPEPNGTLVRAQREAYAESFANYFSSKARWFSDKPALLNYFRAMPRPAQPIN